MKSVILYKPSDKICRTAYIIRCLKEVKKRLILDEVIAGHFLGLR